MATVRDGGLGALVVVDVQKGVVAEAHDRDRVVGNVAAAVERAREAGLPVVWVQHSDAELERGSEAWQWVDELAPADGEPLVHKQYNSSFEETSLEDELATLGASHVVLAGAATNACIRATAYAALDRGYDLTLVADAHTTETFDLGDGVVVSAPAAILDLNVSLQFLSYPDRSNTSTPVADLDLAPLAPAG